MENNIDIYEEIEELKKIKEERERKEQMRMKEYYDELTFTQKTRKNWYEVRREEKNNDFTTRHERLKNAAVKYYGKDSSNLIGKITITHIFGETLYQLNKFKIKRNDNVSKYIMRNRGLAIVLTGAIAVAALSSVDINPEGEYVEPTTSIATEDGKICLTRYYRVLRNDTLSDISVTTGVGVSTIQNDNGIDNPNMIHMNQLLTLNYYITPEDIDYYIQPANIEGKTIQQVADTYHTDIETLVRLNEEAIEINEDNTYRILSDTLLVPNFITTSELREAQANSK